MSAPTRRRRGRGGQGGHEPRARLRLRELQVMEQMLEGRTQHQIAVALGISQPAVSKILRKVEERLLADVAWQIERQRARQSLRLEHLYREALLAWRASQQDTLRRRQRQTGGEGGASVAELVSENRHGDARYLEAARNALADQRKLWGVDAPERLAVAATSPYALMSETALAEELARQRQLLEATVVPETPLPATPASAVKEDPHEPS